MLLPVDEMRAHGSAAGSWQGSRVMAKKKTKIDAGNHLFYGNNLEILDRFDDKSIDLIYSDPPFKSEQDYNVFFAERDGTRSAAQIRAFEDTWQ